MSTTTISTKTGSVLIRAASAYGSVTGAALIPDSDRFDSGTVSVNFDMAEVVAIEPVVIDRDEMRNTRGRNRPDVVGPRVSGSKVAVRRGDVTLTMRVQGLGSSTSDTHALHILLASMLSDSGEPTATDDAVLAFHDPEPDGTAADAYYFRPTTVAEFSEGDVVMVDVDGRPYPLWVTTVDSTVSAEYIGVLGAPRHLTDGDTIRFTRMFKNEAPGPAFDMRFDKDPDQAGAGYRAECFGCRVTGVSTTMTPTGDDAVMRLQLTISVGHLRYDHANAATTAPTYPTGAEVQLIGSALTVTAAVPAEGTAGPYQLAPVSDLYLGQLTVTLGSEVQEVPDHLTVVAGEMTIAEAMADIGVRLTRPQVGFDPDMVDGVERFLAIGLGSPGAGNSLAIVLPCAFSTADPAGRTEDGANVVQQLQLGDETARGTTTASAADSSFIIAITH